MVAFLRKLRTISWAVSSALTMLRKSREEKMGKVKCIAMTGSASKCLNYRAVWLLLAESCTHRMICLLEKDCRSSKGVLFDMRFLSLIKGSIIWHVVLMTFSKNKSNFEPRWGVSYWDYVISEWPKIWMCWIPTIDNKLCFHTRDVVLHTSPILKVLQILD